LGLVKAFLKAGILGEDQVVRDTVTGTPQGGILSPLLANIALSVLDEYFAEAWESFGGTYGRRRRRVHGTVCALAIPKSMPTSLRCAANFLSPCR
jgi:RNA-directed DNA polymerase